MFQFSYGRLLLGLTLLLCTPGAAGAVAAMDDLFSATGMPRSALGRYSYDEPGCNGVLELLPSSRGFRASISTTCASLALCSETLDLEMLERATDGSVTLRDLSRGIDLLVLDETIELPDGADYLCLYGDGRMSGVYRKYSPPPLVMSERSSQLERSLNSIREQASQARGPNVREQATGAAFPLDSRDAEFSGQLMEAYLALPNSRMPTDASRGETIAALIAYHEKVLGSIGYSLEMTVIEAFKTQDFAYWGFLKSSRRADLAAPYLALLDAPEAALPLLQNGTISRQVLTSLIEFAPWYRAAFP